MQFKIEKISCQNIAYITNIGPYGNGNIKTMESLKLWAEENKLLEDNSIILGIARDNPETTKPDDCRYDVCLVLDREIKSNQDNINFGEINGGKYAVFKIEHTKKGINYAWQNAFPYLENKGICFDNERLVFERYKTELLKDNLCEICIPIL